MKFQRALLAGLVLAAGTGSGAQAATPERSVSDRLQDRRYVVSAERAYAVGLPGRPLVRQRLAHHG